MLVGVIDATVRVFALLATTCITYRSPSFLFPSLSLSLSLSIPSIYLPLILSCSLSLSLLSFSLSLSHSLSLIISRSHCLSPFVSPLNHCIWRVSPSIWRVSPSICFSPIYRYIHSHYMIRSSRYRAHAHNVHLYLRTYTQYLRVCPYVGCSSSVDLIFMLDASSSVGETAFQSMLRFVVSLVQDMHIDTGDVRVGLMSFNTDVYEYMELNQYSRKDRITDAIVSMPYISGSTNKTDAFRFVGCRLSITRKMAICLVSTSTFLSIFLNNINRILDI